MAKTRFHSGIKPAAIAVEWSFCLSVKDKQERHHSFAAIAAGGVSSAKGGMKWRICTSRIGATGDRMMVSHSLPMQPQSMAPSRVRGDRLAAARVWAKPLHPDWNLDARTLGVRV